MSGETEELTNDGVSVASNLLWTDNPELEYFRSMMTERMDERVASGLDMNDSLIGDSTLHDMMDEELQMMQSFDSNSLSRESFRQVQRNHNSPRRQHASPLDTSGLSHAEDDTIDNINTEDGSILAWFSRQRKERARKRAEEDGTLESDPAMIDPRQLDPATGLQLQQQQHVPQSQQQQLHPIPQRKQTQPQRRFFSSKRSPDPPVTPQYAHEDNIEIDASIENPSNMCIPGFIFVTSGQSSSVQTRASETQPTKKTKMSSNDVMGDDDRRRRCLSTKVIILCLVLAVVIAGIMLTVVFTNKKTKSSSNSSAQAPGSSQEFPTLAPAPTISPSLQGDAQSSSGTPSDFPIDTLAPTTSSGSAATTTPTVPFSSSSRAPGTQSPTSSPSMASTVPETSSVVARLQQLTQASVEAWQDPSSPQSLAVSWLINDSEAETYSDFKLLQRYVLATLYHSTNGENWSQSSISWIVEWSDECTWWGIECNTAGGVRVLELDNDNLSGSLPPEIQMLSDSLEEIYLNGNKITGRIPSSIGKLSKLRRLQLTGNNFSGSLPTSLSTLENLRNFSVKNNKLSGQLPSELGLLTLLRNFDVSKNEIVGTIPQSYGDMVSLGSMYLFENQLTGTIPTTFNQLADLTIFRAELNNLGGTMPGELCGMDYLSADCIEEISCGAGCCNVCCVDGGNCVEITSPPTSEPTFTPVQTPVAPTGPPLIPTLSPTTVPTESTTVVGTEETTSVSTTSPSDPADTATCRASIGTDRDCYEDGDNIVVTFENCDSSEFDWIGVYSTSTNIMDLGDPLAWVWACGDQFCNDVVDSGQATFYNARGTGSFVVYLLRSNENLDGTFVAYGVGNAFEMSTSCAGF